MVRRVFANFLDLNDDLVVRVPNAELTGMINVELGKAIMEDEPEEQKEYIAKVVLADNMPLSRLLLKVFALAFRISITAAIPVPTKQVIYQV